MNRFSLLRLVVLCVCAANFVNAQYDASRISGTVTDSTGAAIPNARVTVKNENTGEERTVDANDAGEYVATPLKPSAYTLVGQAPGLQPATYSKIKLSIGQERTVNIILQPTGVTQSITVEGGELAFVDTSSARIGVNVSTRDVAQLPINGRQVSQLYLLAPGAVNNGSGNFDNIRFSGRSNQQNQIRFDGIEGSSLIDASPGNLNGETTSTFRLQQSLENVQEFRVDSSNYPAEYGTGTGGQISFVTKGGSNAFHGSVFEYNRNDYFDARNFFDGSQVSKLRLNQYGGSVGGPIQKDKFFFFASYEGLKQRTGTNFVESTLSAEARARAVPSIRPLLRAFPVGQLRSSDPLLDVVAVNLPNTLNEDAGSVRLDYNVNDRIKVYARYFRSQGNSSASQNSSGSLFNTTVVPQNGVIGVSQVISPNIVNEAKFGYNSSKTRVAGIPGASPDFNLAGVTLNLSGSVALGGIAGQTGSAGIVIPSGLIRLSSNFNGRGAPYTNYSLSYIDNLSVISGKHSLKFGVEIRTIKLYNDQQGGTTYAFANVGDFLNNRPSSVTFLGDLSQKSPFTGLSGKAELDQTYYIGYAQDEFRLRPNLTISYGLRYEYYAPISDARNKNVIFDINAGNIIAGSSRDFYKSSRLNFGPRLGISWSPKALKDKTVFRIGSGYYYGPGQTEDQLQPSANDRITSSFSGSSPLNVFPLDTNAVFANYNINNPSLGYQPRAYFPGYSIPEKILSYTASVQQTLPDKGVLTVAYVGSKGSNLFLRSITNKIVGVTMNPTTGAAIVQREFGNRFAEIDFKTSGGNDHYNSLQTTYNRRYTSGLSIGSQYTWAHSIGNSGGSNEANTAGNPFDFRADKGSNNFDVRHSFNAVALYDLPFGRGKKYLNGISRAAEYAVGGWQLGGIVNARSGVPIDVLITRPDVVYRDTRNGAIYATPLIDTNGTIYTMPVVNTLGGGNSRNVRRPDVVAGVDPYQHGNGRNWLNPAAFSAPQPGTFGNSGRNSLTGPLLAQFDLTVSKKFNISERINVEFRAEVYNLLNKTNFGNPANLRLNQSLPSFNNPVAPGTIPTTAFQPGRPFSTSTAGANWGAVTNTVGQQIGLGTNRQIQLSGRINF